MAIAIIVASIGLSVTFFFLGRKTAPPEELQERIKELESSVEKYKGELRGVEKQNRLLLNKLQRLTGYITRLKVEIEQYDQQNEQRIP